VVIRGPAGVALVTKVGNRPAARLLFTPSDPSVQASQVRVDRQGQQVLYDQVGPDQRLASKLARLFKQGGSSEAHNLMLWDLGSGDRLQVETVVTHSAGFRWTASPSFSHLALAPPGGPVTVINLAEESVTAELKVPSGELCALQCNDEGTVLMQVGTRFYLTRTAQKGERTWELPAPEGSELLNLGSECLVLASRPSGKGASGRRIQVVHFCGWTLGQAEQELSSQAVSVNQWGHLDLLRWSDRGLEVTRNWLPAQGSGLLWSLQKDSDIPLRHFVWSLDSLPLMTAQTPVIRELLEQYVQGPRQLSRLQESIQPVLDTTQKARLAELLEH